jgi:hypothetical protein
LEKLQRKCRKLKLGIIPLGDQKTGSIGEFYAWLFLTAKYPGAKLTLGRTSEKGWDIRVEKAKRKPWLVQVKTTSAFAQKRKLSPIHHGWHQLFILYLGLNLQPEGFWIVTDRTIVKPKDVLRCTCRKPDNDPSSGSRVIPFGKNRVTELLEVIAEQLKG